MSDLNSTQREVEAEARRLLPDAVRRAGGRWTHLQLGAVS